MDNRRKSRDPRRLSEKIQTGSESQDLEEASDNSSRIDQYSKYPRNTSTPLRRPKSRNSNVKSVISHNKENFQDDSDDDESSDEIPDMEQVRGSFIDSERSDENPSDRFNIKNSLEESSKVLSKREKRRKTKRRRWREDNCIQKTEKNNEEDIGENRYPMKHRKSFVGKDRSSDDIQRSRKKKNQSKGGLNRSDELPITEILRKSQENSRMQYEEPTPLPQLTTDTIYVQGRNGFSAFKIRGEGIPRGHRDPETVDPSITFPIKIAILAQKAWKNAGLIYQGLLAGMALMHFLFIHTFFKFFQESLVDYSLISEIYTSLFSFFIAMCIVSAFDKYDLAHFNMGHFREIYDCHAKSILALPLYISVFCLHQATLKVDDKFALLNYITNDTKFMNITEDLMIADKELNTWKTLTLAKDGISVFAWIFISLGPQGDMLLTHLQSLEKYAGSS